MRAASTRLRTAWTGGLACLALAACAPMAAQQGQAFEASLSGSNQVPAVATAGTGHAEARYDHSSRILRWRVTHERLSGPVTGAHIHGPAGPGQEAGAVLPLGNPGAGAFSGEARITPEQWNQLDSGQWYLNLRTARHPGGEIRGQLRPRP